MKNRFQGLRIIGVFFACHLGLSASSTLAVQPSATLSAASAAQSQQRATDRIIVKFNATAAPLANLQTRQSALERLAPNSGARLSYVRRMSTGAEVLSLSEKKNPANLQIIINELNARSDVEYAEPDLIMQPLATPNDARYSEQWHYFEATGGLNLPTAWDISTGTGAVVAVLDTGFRPHPDLNANLLPGYDMISDTFVARDGDGRDADAIDPGDWSVADECAQGDPGSNSSWHGTHVAGTIAAVTNNGSGVAGVAYGAKIVPVRVLGRCGGYTSDIADGMIWAAGGSVTGVATNPNPAQVLNLSLGGGGTCGSTTQAAIDTARGLGATVVVAAGNSNTNASNATPANCAGVVAVASTNRSGSRAYYSNFGNVVDVAAPGGETIVTADGVLSTLNNGTTTPGADNYAFYQGTSMATPHVAGVAALLYAMDDSLSPDQIESILKNSSRAFPGTCNQCGTGIVDAAAALALANGGGGGSDDPELVNGEAITGLSANQGNQLRFTMEVPQGASDLSFTTSGGSGDADLYVRFGSAPTTASYDCRPYRSGNNETCTFSSPQAGTYHVMLDAYSTFSAVSLVGNYGDGSGSGGGNSSISETNLSGNAGSWQHFTIEVGPGASQLLASMSGGSGDADLYVRYGSQPTTGSYNCRPYRFGNQETCTLNNPAAGTWYVSVHGYQSYTDVSLQAQ